MGGVEEAATGEDVQTVSTFAGLRVLSLGVCAASLNSSLHRRPVRAFNVIVFAWGHAEH